MNLERFELTTTNKPVEPPISAVIVGGKAVPGSRGGHPPGNFPRAIVAVMTVGLAAAAQLQVVAAFAVAAGSGSSGPNGSSTLQLLDQGEDHRGPGGVQPFGGFHAPTTCGCSWR